MIQRPMAWLDDDGKHVWSAHDCRGEWVVAMLPWPTWHAMASSDDRVIWLYPSFHCQACGLHEWLPIVATTAPPSVPRDLGEQQGDDRGE